MVLLERMLSVDQLNLGLGFRKHYTIVPASTEILRDQAYRIRHEVYCEELRYEPERPDRLESDKYDSHSLHCLISSTANQATSVGCTRIVLANPADPDAPLPFERISAATLDRSLVDPAKLQRGHIAEVSRLAVRSLYRRRKGEGQSAVALSDEDYGTGAQPRFPYISIGLYLAAVSLASRNGIDTLFVLTEPRLAAHFRKLGVDIRQIGEPVEHRGLRVPSMMDVQAIIRDLRHLLVPIWNAVNEDIDRGYAQTAVDEELIAS